MKNAIPIISVAALAITVVVITVSAATSPSRQQVLIATHDLPAGITLTSRDVRPAELQIGDSASNYLTTLGEGFKLNQTLAKGQLVPRNQIEAEPDQKFFPIRLNNLRPTPSAISVGDRVDIWATKQTQLTKESPEPVAFEAIVTFVENTNSMGQSTTVVELRVDENYLESLLAAIDSNSQLSLILHETIADLG